MRATTLAWFSALVRAERGQSSPHTCGSIDFGVGNPENGRTHSPLRRLIQEHTRKAAVVACGVPQRTRHPPPPFYFQAWGMVPLG